MSVNDNNNEENNMQLIRLTKDEGKTFFKKRSLKSRYQHFYKAIVKAVENLIIKNELFVNSKEYQLIVSKANEKFLPKEFKKDDAAKFINSLKAIRQLLN